MTTKELRARNKELERSIELLEKYSELMEMADKHRPVYERFPISPIPMFPYPEPEPWRITYDNTTGSPPPNRGGMTS